MWTTRKERTIIAVLGGNTVAGLALSLLSKGVGYETGILKAPPDVSRDLLRDVDVLLIAPGLGDRRRGESLAALGGLEGRLSPTSGAEARYGLRPTLVSKSALQHFSGVKSCFSDRLKYQHICC
jgi:hypothetical protein